MTWLGTIRREFWSRAALCGLHVPDWQGPSVPEDSESVRDHMVYRWFRSMGNGRGWICMGPSIAAAVAQPQNHQQLTSVLFISAALGPDENEGNVELMHRICMVSLEVPSC